MATDIGTGPDPRPNGESSASAQLDRRFELLEAILLAVAAVLTAWAAFQATKWGGVQADSYSRAGATRTESVRAATRAGQLSTVDVNTFTSWVAAVSAEERAGIETGLADDGSYEPQAGTESGFLYARFRNEFRTAVDTWLASRPLVDPNAAPTRSRSRSIGSPKSSAPLSSSNRPRSSPRRRGRPTNGATTTS